MTRALGVARFVAVLAIVAVSVGIPATAQADSYVDYQGTLTTTISSSGLGPGYSGDYGPHVGSDSDTAYPASVECVAARCVLGYARDVYSPEVTLVDGRADLTIPGHFGECSELLTYDPQPTVTIHAVATADTLTYSVFEDFGGSYVECSNGGRTETANYLYEFSGDYVSGETCDLLGQPCPESDLPIDDPGLPIPPTVFTEPAFGTTVGYGNDVSELASRPADAAAPSVLSGLPGMFASYPDPIRTLSGLLAALALTAIVGLGLLASPTAGQFAGNLLGNFPWVKAVGKRLRAVRDGATRATNSFRTGPPVVVWITIAVTYAIAVLLSTLLDPGVGLNSGTGRMLLSLLAVFAVQSVLGWFVIRTALRRSGSTVEFRPTINPGLLVLIVGGVLFSRILGFEPGVVFGALLGLTFGATLQGTKNARAVIVGSIFTVALSFVSWLAYSVLIAVGLQDSGVVGVFVLETLSALVVAGASGLAIALLPHKAFDGKSVWDVKKIYWALLYAGGAFYAIVVLGLIPVDPSQISAPLVGWLVLYAVYGVVILVLFLLARRAAKPPAPATATAEEPRVSA